MKPSNRLMPLGSVGMLAMATARFTPQRYWQPEPAPTGRYVKWLSMDPVEDPRLGHGAVRLLQVIRSLAGRTTWLGTTQAALGRRLRRSARQIRRYLRELERFGYLRIQKHVGRSGLIVGLFVYLTQRVLPRFKDLRRPKPMFSDRTNPTDIKVETARRREEGTYASLPEPLARALIRLGESLEARRDDPRGGGTSPAGDEKG